MAVPSLLLLFRLSLVSSFSLSAGSRKAKQENPEFYQQRILIMDTVETIHESSSFPSAQLAVQLTLIEQRLYCNTRPNEFFFGNWKRPNKDDLCPNIVALINWFNRTTDWIISEIVMGLTVKRRVKTLKKFIRVAAVLSLCWHIRFPSLILLFRSAATLAT